MSCRCPSHYTQPASKPAQPRRNWREATVTIVRGGRSSVVRPVTLPTTFHTGELSVRLDELWIGSHLDGDLGDLRFDLVGADGFRPSRYGHPTLPGAMLTKGYLHIETGRVEWGSSGDLACAYRLKGLAMIVAFDEETVGQALPPPECR